jgi:crotonobetainyl-CoA:carnitine CoA-transferase CaiB-like acyl-CoA transferase
MLMLPTTLQHMSLLEVRFFKDIERYFRAHAVVGNGDSIYKRLMAAIGRTDLTGDFGVLPLISVHPLTRVLGIGQGYLINSDRVKNQAEIEAAITEWTSQRSPEEVVRVMGVSRLTHAALAEV